MPGKRIFIDSDGNLKAVPVGICMVVLLVSLLALLVQVKEPARETAVKITHVFKAVSRQKQQKQHVPEKRTTEKAVKAKKKNVIAGKKPPVENTQKPPMPEKTIRTSSTKTKQKPAVVNPEKSSQQRKESATGDETVATSAQKKKHADMRMGVPGEKDVTVPQNEEKPEKKVWVEKSFTKTARKNTNSIAPLWSNPMKKMDRLHVPAEVYSRIYKNRFRAGNTRPENLYRWRVANRHRLKLKDFYRLFDMKAVAVTNDGRFIDLGDLSALSKAYLGKTFSRTVIVCGDPEADFGDMLQKLKVSAQDVTVRYYMYEHIRNYFYNRVQQAVAYCRNKGLIPGGNDVIKKIDVIGSVFELSKDKGSFGVFVPTAVYFDNPKSGTVQEFMVPPEWFAGEEDVKYLTAQKLL